MQKLKKLQKPTTMKTKICSLTLATIMATASICSFAATDAPHVKNPKYDASILVKEAFNNVSKNYEKDDSQLSAYYKETIQKGSYTVSLNEALIDVEKASYLSIKNDKIIVKKIRKNNNVTNDLIVFKLQGGPNNVARLDIMKYSLPGCDVRKFDDIYVFEYDTPVEQDGKIFYVVKFDQKQECDEILYRGKIYIDSESHAVAKVEFSMNVEDRGDAYLSFIKNKPSHLKIKVTEAKYVVGYKKYNGKWYYDFSRSDVGITVKNKKDRTEQDYTITSGMVVTNYHAVTASNSGVVFKPYEILADKKLKGDDSLEWELYDELMLLAML